jgi:hypothetical protein
MKTDHFAYMLGMPVLLALLWSVSVVNSSELDFRWAAIELCILIGTYVMCAHSSFFSFIPDRNKKTAYGGM